MRVLNDYLDGVDPSLHQLVRWLDALILETVPDLQCSLKWGNPTYHRARNLFAVIAHAGHVNLQIWGGAALQDPRHLLAGTGKSMRHIKFAGSDDVDRFAVAALLRAAAKLNPV